MAQLTTAEAVAKYGISRRTLIRMAERKQLRIAETYPVRIADGYKFEDAEVAEAIRKYLPRKGKALEPKDAA